MILCKDSGLFDPLFCSFITTFELESIFFFVFFAKWKKLFNVKSGRKNDFCTKVKNSRATLLISLKLASSMHGIFDWWLKVGIVPTLEFRFPVPLERVEDLIRGENFRRRCFRVNSPRANKRNVYLLISNLLVK